LFFISATSSAVVPDKPPNTKKLSTKERHFKLGLQRRLEIICNALSVLGSDYNYLDADITFHRSLPENMQEIADYISKVGHLLSTETQISMLGLDIDAQAEIEKKQQETDASVSLPFDVSGDANA
jgi:SPP1 family phage portal protein